MLKKIAFLLVAATMVMFTGCKDEEAGPIIDFDGGLGLGAFPRLQQLDFAEFDLADLNGSVYQHTVDFVDGNASADIAEYNVLIAFDDNNPDNGDNSTDFTVWTDVSVNVAALSDVDPETGNKVFTLTIPFSAAATFVGVAPDAVISGDRFQFRTEIVKTDGRVFNSVNSTPAVTNAFGGIWNWNVNATCPLPDTDFTGSYAITYGYVYDEFPLFGAPVQALGNPPLSLTVDLATVSGSTTRRGFDIGTTVNPGYGFGAAPMTLEFACDVVTSSAIDSGAGCGGGSIAAVQMGTAAFDLADDSSWTIEYTEYGPNDGGCGVGAVDYSLVFTKQ